MSQLSVSAADEHRPTTEFGTDSDWPVERQDGLFYSITSNASFPVNHVEYSTTAHINEFGGRVTPSSSLELPKTVFLGDSFTFGIGVEDEETYVSLLERASSERLLNLGVPGSCLSNQTDIIRMRHDGLGRPHTYILSIFLGNDFVDLQRYANDEHLGWFREPKPGSAPDSPISRNTSWSYRLNAVTHRYAVFRNSYLFQFLRQNALLALLEHNSRDPDRRDSFIRLQLREPIFPMMDERHEFLGMAFPLLEEQLDQLMHLAQEQEFDVRFIVIPDRHQISQQRRAAQARYYGIDPASLDPLRPNRMVAAELERRKIPFTDLTTTLQRAPQADRLYYNRDNHFTAYGHRLTAEIISASGLLTIPTE